MSLYPLSALIGDTTIFAKSLASVAIVFCFLFVLAMYRRQKGSNLIKAKNDATNRVVKSPRRRNSSSQLPDTASALLNKPDNISVVMNPESRNEATALSNHDTGFLTK